MTPRAIKLRSVGQRVAGAGFLIASAGIHLDLYLTGYRNIPTIGVLFLLQCASAGALALALLALDRWLIRLSGAGFALSTIVGYALSRFVGLFGFHERPTAAGLTAGLLELGVLVALLPRLDAGAAAEQSGSHRARLLDAAADLIARPLLLALVASGSLALVLAAGIGSTGPANSETAANAPSGPSVHVVIVNFAFRPAHVVARAGETILVRNEDSVDHTLTAMPGSTPLGHFNTGDIAPGQTRGFRAPRASGTYAFYCSIHNFMTGDLTVTS